MRGTDLSTKEVNTLLNAVFEKYGYDFRDYSKSSIIRQLNRFMSRKHFENLYELQYYLQKNEAVFADFLEAVTINVTEMFRDPSFYKSMRENIIPELKSYPFIKIWHAGCSTGEEVYSMAITLHEEGILQRCKIYGTDINPRVIKEAYQGIFSLQPMKEYTANYRAAGGKGQFSDYYTAKYDKVIFDSFLRENISLSVHNLVTDQRFNDFNLIVCRNVLIYFDKKLQDHVIRLFTDSLTMFGYLALGIKESLLFAGDKEKYEVIDSANKIFRRIK